MPPSHSGELPAQQTSLLMPKLQLPRLPSLLVTRTRLLTRLDMGLTRKLTLLAAPAGSGKTTLVRQWIAEHEHSGQMPHVAWVSLDPEDDDPIRFWRYVLTACQSFQHEPGRAALAQLSANYAPFGLHALKAALTLFLNDIACLPERHMLVLEDYHVIAATPIHEALAFVIDHLPDSLHIVLITRNIPMLPLARWRARDELQEVQDLDLRFSREEISAFLQQALPFTISIEKIASLDTHVEGWITGLRLLMLALQGRTQPQEIERVLTTFTGSHRYLLDYFASEVLASQPETVQRFVLQTSMLTRITASLCDAITRRSDSAQLLDAVERAGLFLQPLDGAEPWYRYHGLFAEAMQAEARRRLGDEALRVCLSRASVWYEQHGMYAEAVEVALRAAEPVRAATLIERNIELQHFTDPLELPTLSRWLEQLPEQVLEEFPALCFAYAIVLLFTLDRSSPTTLARLEGPLALAEQGWQTTDRRSKLAEVQSLRSQAAWWQGHLPLAFAFAHRSLELSSEQEDLWHAGSMLLVGEEQLLAGKPDAAWQTVQRALTLFEAAASTHGVRAALSSLANICMQQGRLHQAEQFYQQILLGAGQADPDPSDQGIALLGLAHLAYEWNDLSLAEQRIEQALDLGRRYMSELGTCHARAFLIIPTLLSQVSLLAANDQTTRARDVIQQIINLTQEHKWPLLYREALACQAELSLISGDRAEVQRWYETCTRLGEDFRIVQQEREAIITARLLLAQGGVTTALNLLERWLTDARAQQRRSSELELQVDIALAYAAQGCQIQAKQFLKEALIRAQPEGYRRIFLNRGAALHTLLREVLPDLGTVALADHVRSLLTRGDEPPEEQGPLISDDINLNGPLTVPPVEPLSPQEQRVLHLLAAGRSNPEIAEALIVSINTVKTQVQSIYRKLNVNNRWQAREAARHLRLL